MISNVFQDAISAVMYVVIVEISFTQLTHHGFFLHFLLFFILE